MVLARRIISKYIGFPNLTKKLFPVVALEHFVAAFCLNISVYFKKVHSFSFYYIGESISIYYLGCFVGALLGGAISLKYMSTKISGLGLIILGFALSLLLNSSSQMLSFLSMLTLGVVGTIVTTCNMTSLIRSVGKSEHIQLRVISFELILFNIVFSLVTFVLIDLSSKSILLFLHYLSAILILTGLYSITVVSDKLFIPKRMVDKNAKWLPDNINLFTVVMIMVFCFGLIFSMVKVVFTPTLIFRFGDNMISVTAASINPWVLFFIQPLVIDKIRSTNSSWFLGVGALMVGLSYFIFGLVNSFFVTCMVLALLTLGEIMFSPLSKHYNVKLYGIGREGVASGVWRATFLGSGVIGSGFSGFLSERAGVNSVWLACGLLGVLCFLFSLVLRKIETNGNLSTHNVCQA